MITPRAFELIIKHFNEIDKIVSQRTVRKRPWLEVALTSLLCDLMDEETQQEEKIEYTISQLQSDLEKEDGLFGIKLALETIEFNPNFERYVSQSDIGIKIIFDNKIEPKYSWSRPYLLQAKRLIPKKINPLYYSEASRFGSVDKEQQQRIELLNNTLGSEYVRYMLYCPRPEFLNEDMRIKLSYLRAKNFSNNIFDFTKGLRLHKELLLNKDTLKAGIFITDTSNSNINFGSIHKQILRDVYPFSWFLALNFLEDDDFPHSRKLKEKLRTGGEENDDLVNGILAGDKTKIRELIDKLKKVSEDDFPKDFTVLPKHIITLKFSVGDKLNENSRFIHEE